MQTYKAPDNTLHCIDPEFAHMLPTGCVAIAPEEAEAIRQATAPASVPPSPADQIAELERQTMLPRITREFMLSSVELEASKQGITPEQLYQANVGYKRLKDLDVQIRALRALL